MALNRGTKTHHGGSYGGTELTGKGDETKGATHENGPDYLQNCSGWQLNQWYLIDQFWGNLRQKVFLALELLSCEAFVIGSIRHF